MRIEVGKTYNEYTTDKKVKIIELVNGPTDYIKLFKGDNGRLYYFNGEGYYIGIYHLEKLYEEQKN